MRIESHTDALQEYLTNINLAKARPLKNKRTIALLCSQAAMEMISILFQHFLKRHGNPIVPKEVVIKHTWLNSLKWWGRLTDFPKKELIQDLSVKIEDGRDFTYRSVTSVTKEQIIQLLKDFFKLKNLVEELIGKDLEEVENES